MGVAAALLVIAVGWAQLNADVAASEGCGGYETWDASVELASPLGRGPSPDQAVRQLVDDRVEVVAVLDQQTRRAKVRVVRDGIDGIYGVERAGGDWVVTSGKGCGASGGAPMPPKKVECLGGEPASPGTDEFLTYCSIEGPYPTANDYFYPSD